MFGGGNDNSVVQPTDGQPATPLDSSLDNSAAAPGVPSDTSAPTYSSDSPYSTNGSGSATQTDAPTQDTTAPSTDGPTLTPMPESNDALLNIKQQALQQLSPLVGHLDQSPEEKFRTTMMMIQASDNAELIKDAYAAAQQITDEKARAQALLDVVNEINYFTQHHEQQ